MSETVHILIFSLAAAGALLGAMLAISCRNLVYSVLSMTFCLLCLALILFQLQAGLPAALLAMLGAAGAGLLLIFVAVVLDLGRGAERRFGNGRMRILSTVGAGAVLLWLLGSALWEWPSPPPQENGIALSVSLFDYHLLSLLGTALLLLLALVGAVLLTRREDSDSSDGEWMKR